MCVLKQSVDAAPAAPLSSFSQACPVLRLREPPPHLHSGQAQKESFFNAKYQQGSQGVNYSSTSPAPICLQSALLAPLRTQSCPGHPRGFLRVKTSP